MRTLTKALTLTLTAALIALLGPVAPAQATYNKVTRAEYNSLRERTVTYAGDTVGDVKRKTGSYGVVWYTERTPAGVVTEQGRAYRTGPQHYQASSGYDCWNVRLIFRPLVPGGRLTLVSKENWSNICANKPGDKFHA